VDWETRIGRKPRPSITDAHLFWDCYDTFEDAMAAAEATKQVGEKQ